MTFGSSYWEIRKSEGQIYNVTENIGANLHFTCLINQGRFSPRLSIWLQM